MTLQADSVGIHSKLQYSTLVMIYTLALSHLRIIKKKCTVMKVMWRLVTVQPRET